MANLCKKCGQEEKPGLPEERGAACTVCTEWYHLRCITADRRLRGEPLVCEKCAKQGPQDGGTSDASSSDTTIVFNPRQNSTSMQESSEDLRDAELRMLRELVKQYQLGGPDGHVPVHRENSAAKPLPPASAIGAVTCVGSGMNANPTLLTVGGGIMTAPGPSRHVDVRNENPSFGQGGPAVPPWQQQWQNVNNANNSTFGTSFAFDRTAWRSRLPEEVIKRTVAPPPLTRDQIARRKTMETVLPVFAGNPLKWLKFITSYLETAGPVCGFTPREDMNRVRAALKDPALGLVKEMLDDDQNLESVLGLLQMSYGETSMILAAMTAKVDALPPLDGSLSNIATFAGRVDQLRNVNNMMDGKPPQLELVRKLERKLPLPHAEKWLQYKAQVKYGPHTSMFEVAMGPVIDGTLDHMADFLFMLYKTMASLGIHVPMWVDSDDEKPSSAKSRAPGKKPVLMVKEVVAETSSEEPVAGGARKQRWQKLREKKKLASKPAVSDAVVVSNAAPATCRFKCGHPAHKWTLCPEFKKMSIPARWNWTKKLKKCFLCFGDHQQSTCEAQVQCNVERCGKRHHPLLHPVDINIHEVVNFMSEEYKHTLFRIVPVTVVIGEVLRRIMVIMDSGSSVTLIDSALAEDMRLTGLSEVMTLSWTDGEVQPALNTKRVTLEVTNPDTGHTHRLGARTYDNLKLPANKITRQLLEEEGLGHLPIACGNEEVPLVLLGQDNVVLMRTIGSFVGASERVVASETPLGFVLEGEYVMTDAVCLFTKMSPDATMERMLQEFIDGEHFGLRPDSTVRVESDDVRRARSMMESNTVQREDGRYETGLLWARDDVVLPNNRQCAVDRCRSFNNKLRRDPALKERVTQQMKSHLDNGYVRRVVDGTEIAGRVWYLPIFNVHNPAKPEKLRLVYDAAVSYKNVSLNSVLLSGPDLTVPLLNVLLRFRTNPVAISGDLKDMYHRVYVKEEDRCAQRFVWLEGDEMVDYEMCVLPFGCTCSPSLAQYVKNVNAERYREEFPAAVDAIVNDHYIDDWLGGGRTEEEVLALTQAVMKIHADGGFTMHKFLSNSPAVLSGLGISSEDIEVQLSDSAILGMMWNTANDTLALRFRANNFTGNLFDGSCAPTKRGMLRAVMSIYDPMGIVSFVTMEAKILLREAWRERADWDDELTGAIQRRWNEWTTHLAAMQDVVVPRWHGTVDEDVDLHVYADASETAMAAVCYVVQRCGDHVRRSLVMSKCLVAPLHAKSIPRLELDAAVLGVRVLRMVRAANLWTVNRVVLWTDAMDVIWWLRSSKKRYSPYVANRITDILTETVVDQWRWTPTDLNPADWGTKWCGQRDNENLWWSGPDYLGEDESQWPELVQEVEQLLEVRPLLMTKCETATKRSVFLLPDAERFSRWLCFRNACAYVLKAVAIMQKRAMTGPLNDEDIERAEAEIFRSVQVGLEKNKEHTAFLSTLSPFIDQRGVMRMRGRAARSENLPFDARFPVIVLGDHPVILLLIQHYHRSNCHQNATTVVNELRQKVIMPRMKTSVRRVISSCRLCAVRRTKPIVPQLGALPMSRMAVYMSPFSFVGIDYFGPYNVLIGRRHELRYGVLMTCLTTRAVYLELAFSLSTPSCVGVLDSLVARRGMPLEFYSDNATCFGGAAKVFIGPHGVRPTWRFIPPRCPTMGGAWERLVGVTKRALDGMLLPKIPTEERLRHSLMRAERLVNARPLTDIPMDPEEEEMLTPNHFLLGSSSGIKPKVMRATWDPKISLEKWNEIVDAFWTKFAEVYLPTISPRTTGQDKTRNLEVGDLVFICDQDYRAGWRRAKIVQVLEDSESHQVREVVVETGDGKQYRRVTAQLAMILRGRDCVANEDSC